MIEGEKAGDCSRITLREREAPMLRVTYPSTGTSSSCFGPLSERTGGDRDATGVSKDIAGGGGRGGVSALASAFDFLVLCVDAWLLQWVAVGVSCALEGRLTI